jgi:hypothetical protein
MEVQKISRDEAWRRYLIGDYTMRVPPVCTDNWDDWDWVRWTFPNIKPEPGTEYGEEPMRKD